MISGVFIDRPRLAIVIAIVITLAGLIAMTRIPVAQFPDIVPPQVTVSATYPGASAAVVEATVAQPLEAQVNGADQMLYMSSNSANDGTYSLTVSFALGTNPDINVVNVNNRVQAALSRLPAEVQHSGVTVQKRSSAILEFLQFYSDNPKQDPLFISNYVTINVLDALNRVPGVGQAFLFGALNYSMRIWFRTDRLIQLGLTPSDIIAAIGSQNVQAAIGRVGARPTSNETQFQINLQTKGRLSTPEEFGNIVIRANPDGSMLRVRDVARVELGAQNMDSLSRLDGHPAVSIGIYLAPGANAVQTSARVQATLNRLGNRFPEGLHAKVFYDSSTFVSDTIREVLITLGEAFVLVVIVVFLFLGKLRTTIIPTVAVPVSLIGTFALLLTFGFSANTVTLLALVLAIGIVVDDAIVVVENVERVMEEEPDLPRRDAVKKAMAQITAPIIAITLVLLSVFVPIAFVPGLQGSLFRQFSVTIIVAMLISALNALTLSPRLVWGGAAAQPQEAARHHGRRAAGHRRDAQRLRLARTAPGTPLGDLRAGRRRLCRGNLWHVADHPHGLPAGRGSGCVLRRRAVARRRLGKPHARHDEEGGGGAARHSLDPERAVDRRLLAARRRQPAQQRLPGRAHETVRRPRRRRQQRADGGWPRVRRRPIDPQRQCHRLQPAAHHRPVHRRRLRIPVAGGERAGSGGHAGTAAGDGGRGQPRQAAVPGVLDLQRQQSFDLPRHRPRQGAGARTVHQ